MKNLILVFLASALLFSVNSFAKGHGGGGHGGGHSGGHGGGHSGGRGGGGGHIGGRQGSGHMSRGGYASPRTTSRTMGASQRTTSGTLPTTNQINGFRSVPRTNTNVGPRKYGVIGTPNANYHPYEHWNSYPYYYYGYYGYAPYYDPYFSMWSFGLNFMYTPHYYPTTSGYNNDNQGGGGSNDRYDDNESMEGFVVYEHDTISGEITITNNAVLLETADTARGYDYKFKMKQQGLQYVSVYDNNDTNNQLNLVRLKDDNKKLLRQVHTGKLAIYDGRHTFIHRPEDIDVGTIMVVYNGQSDAIYSSSVGKTKEWLTEYVNKAYGLTLNPKDFTWKELLIYIDKLD